MWVNARGLASCCPQNHSFYGNVNDEAPQALWNNAIAQRVRKQVAAGEYAAAGCESECPYLRGDFAQPETSPPLNELINPDFDWSDGSDTYAQNVQQVAHDYIERSSVCRGLPLMVDMQPVLRCNLDCTMCGQPHDSPLVHDDALREKLQALAPSANYFRWQGGEVFLDRAFRADLERQVELAPEHLHLKVITNGTILSERALETLVRSERGVEFLLSMDGVRKSSFEKVRLQAKYERVVQSLESLARIQGEVGRKIVTWNYVVMRSTLDDMDLAITRAEELGVSLNFAALQGDFPRENPFMTTDEAERKRLIECFEALQKRANDANVEVSGFSGLLTRMQRSPRHRLPILNTREAS